LIPIDARLASDRDADDEAIPLERMLSSVDGAKKLRVVILDACRDNPFAASMRHERKSGNRGVSAGLGKVEPTGTDTLIAYAAKAGSTADDGDGQHSPFATGLLKNLTVPGLDIRLAFGRVRDDVMKITSNRQEPFVYGSLGGGIVSLMPAPADQQDSTVADSKADYELVAKIGTRQAWEVFLGTHKAGFYSDLARAQLASLRDQLPRTDTHSSSVSVPPINPKVIGSGQEPSREALEWDKIKDTSDQSELRQFIQRYPDSPLSINAKRRLDLLQQSVKAHEDKARAEHEKNQKVAPDGRKSEGIAADNHEKDISPARRKSKRQAEREPIGSRPTSESNVRQQANAHSTSHGGGHSMISVGF
jgi:Caspase domain